VFNFLDMGETFFIDLLLLFIFFSCF